MNNWKMITIYDEFLVTDYVANGSFASLRENVQYKNSHDYAVLVRTTDNTKGWNGDYKYVDKSSYEFLKKSYLLPNDLIIANVGEPGKAFLCPDLGQPMTLGPNAILVRSLDKNKIFNKYFYYYTISKMGQDQIQKICSATTQKKFNKTSYRGLKIPLPPLSEQQRIVKILDAADSLRKKTQQVIDSYDELAQSIFLDMFGDPATNPNNWDLVEFGKHIDILTDYHANGSYEILNKNVKLKNTPDYAIMIRTTDLEKNTFEGDAIYISESAYNFLKKTKIHGGEIIINKIGSAGKVYLMPFLNKPASLGMNAFMLRFKPALNYLFIYFLLKSKYGENEIQKRVKGAVTKTIRKDAIREIPIIFPPPSLQNKFAEKIQLIEKQKELAKQSLQESEDLFQSLLQKAFNGELSN
jgi:type I restriction enzyme S subunit